MVKFIYSTTISQNNLRFESSVIFNYFQTKLAALSYATEFESSVIFNYFQTLKDLAQIIRKFESSVIFNYFQTKR